MIHEIANTEDTAIQAALDAGGVVRLPAGYVVLNRPLVMSKPGTKLIGDPTGETKISPQFSGHAVLVQPARPLPAPGPSLVPGPGGAVRRPWLLLDTEPRLAAMGGRTAFCVSYFFRRESVETDAAVHLHAGGVYGDVTRDAYGVWDAFGRMRVWWNGGTTYDSAPGVAQDVGTTYFAALTFDGMRLRLLVGPFGGTLSAAVDVPMTGTVPVNANGLDPVGIGFNPLGPYGQTRSHLAPDAWFDGFEFANTVRFRPGDPVPAVKPAPTPDSALVFNWETDGPFYVGRRAPGYLDTGATYILPTLSTETQGARFEIRDIQFLRNVGGASGPCLWDAIDSTVERVTFYGCWYGLTLRGSTYAGKVRDVGGVCQAFAWLQTGQSEVTTASGVSPSAAGIPFFTAGSVGGTYTNLFVSPLYGALCSVYCSGSNEVNLFGGQVDDEGQAGAVRAAVVCDAATVKLFGTLVTRATPGPLVVCARGGSIQSFGSWLNGTELVHLADPPAFPVLTAGNLIQTSTPP